METISVDKASWHLRVRKDLCAGCGFCVQNCPQKALSIDREYAEIDQAECNLCLLCVDLCSNSAIAEIIDDL